MSLEPESAYANMLHAVKTILLLIGALISTGLIWNSLRSLFSAEESYEPSARASAVISAIVGIVIAGFVIWLAYKEVSALFPGFRKLFGFGE